MNEAGTEDGAGSVVGDGGRGGVGVTGAVAGADTGGRSWIAVGDQMLA